MNIFQYDLMIVFVGEEWQSWTEWSTDCAPQCWKIEHAIPMKTRQRCSSISGQCYEDKTYCDKLKICEPGLNTIYISQIYAQWLLAYVKIFVFKLIKFA